MSNWEYTTAQIVINDKWSGKGQKEELQKFSERLNEYGAEGWELVSYDMITMKGGWSGGDKTTGLALFKRPKGARWDGSMWGGDPVLE